MKTPKELEEELKKIDKELDKLVDHLSLCCGAEITDYGFCSDCHENI